MGPGVGAWAGWMGGKRGGEMGCVGAELGCKGVWGCDGVYRVMV